MPERLVIVGGVAGGMTAAVWARRQAKNLDITVIERGDDISYSECGMPYVFSNQVASLDNLILYRPEQLGHERNLEILTGHQAESLNSSTQSIEIRDLRNNSTRKLYFDYLVLATGARPIRPEIAGLELPGVFMLRHMPEARAINSYLKSAQPRRAVIIGGGYLGLEMAEALRARELNVTLLDRGESLLKNLTGQLQQQLSAELTAQGVEVRLKQQIFAIEGRERVEQVATAAGKLAADIVIVATGVKPEVALAQQGGIRLGASGAIAVKESQQTNLANIYAAGDCCEAQHLVLERPVYLPLGTTANKQGRIAGINAAGGRAQLKGIVGTIAVKVFQLEIATTGLSLAEASQAGFLAREIETSSVSRAGYYPGAARIDVNVVYDERTGRLLGAQMVGREAIAKRIDTIATALYGKLRIEDLLQLDLSYAPPFAAVWEAIAYAARKVE